MAAVLLTLLLLLDAVQPLAGHSRVATGAQGDTSSTNFPTTGGAVQTSNAGSPNNAFAAKLSIPLPTPTATPIAPTPVTLHLHYAYDAANRRVKLTLPDGQAEQWGYDLAGRVSNLVQPGSAPNGWAVGHDGAGNLTRLSAPNGGVESWGYDAAGRPITTTWAMGVGGTVLFSQTATLDAAGQRTALDDSWGHSSFGYDQAGRLVGAAYPDGSSEQDQYDAAGNRTVITSTTTLGGTTVYTNSYDKADQLTGTTNNQSIAQVTYSYDGDGNQTQVRSGTSTVYTVTASTYNDLRQLVHVSGPGTNLTLVSDGHVIAPQKPDHLISELPPPGCYPFQAGWPSG